MAIIFGTPGNLRLEQIFGTAEDDLIFPLAGWDFVDGRAGVDTVIVDGNSATFTVVTQGDSTYIDVVSGASDSGNRAELVNVERIAFVDKGLALDLDGAAGDTAKLIGALFGADTLREKGLVAIGLSLFDAGMSIEAVAGLALGTDLYLGLAGSRSNADFVRLVYRNVTGSSPDADAIDYYVGLLDSGAHTQATLAALAAETPQNAASIDLVGLRTHGLDYALQG